MRNTATVLCVFVFSLSAATVLAQDAPSPDEGAPDVPGDTPGTDEPASEPVPEPETPPAPEPQPYAQPAPQPPPPPPPQPPPAQYEGEANYAYGNEYGADGDASDEGEGEGGGEGFEMPPFSIRLDPFNWLLEGRLGFELEVGLWKFISVELVPILVASTEPPTFNFSGREDTVSQHSNGLGPFSGTSVGLGFWLDGEPFRGYVLRAIFTNYGYTYEARDGLGKFDEVSHTERQIIAFFGSYARWGFFTLGGGIGLGYELNQKERCDPAWTLVDGVDRVVAVNTGCDELHIAINRFDPPDIADLNGFLHPAVLTARFSLGVAFD
jgi:hypothetical protein